MNAVALTDRAALLRALGIDQDSIRFKFAQLVHLARGHWIVVAKQRLLSSERAYTGAIQPEVFTISGLGMVGAITLAGRFPCMVEHGAEPWDLRETLLASPKAKTSKDGYRYLIVPFRHMGPRASGRNAPALGSAYRHGHLGNLVAFGLGRAVHAAAAKLGATTTDPTTGDTKWGGRLSEDQGGPLARDRHATGIYTGMVRHGKAYAKSAGSQFSTFRVISNNPDTLRQDVGGYNWTHPGIGARNLMTRVQDYVERIAPSVWATS